MFDHVTLRVADLARSKGFYDLAFEAIDNRGTAYADQHLLGLEWNDFSLYEGEPTTTRLHVAFGAPSRGHVDAFWRALTGAGHADDGAPGLRPEYSPDYYGAFVLDPDGNSIEAVYKDNLRKDGGCIDHLWLRVRDVDGSVAFYETVGPVLGFRLRLREHEWAHFRGGVASFTVTSPESDWSAARPPTQNVHLAFPAANNATVDEFHRTALAAGYRDNGRPGEREYHPGYYGAFVLDPDGNNVEAVCHNRD